MATTMNALNSPQIRHAEFVRLTLESSVQTFCNAGGTITVNGISFTGLSSLLGISDIQRDIKSTSDDLTVSLTGIDPSNIALILGNEIKGAIVEIWRGFLDDNNQIATISGQQQFFKRYQGIVNNVSISENFNEEARTRVATCTISCASFKNILENRVAGVRTNPTLWRKLYPNDSSMDRVPVIQSQYFDFGKPPIQQTQSTPSNTTTESTIPVDTSGGG